jgi:hypothetical protein
VRWLNKPPRGMNENKELALLNVIEDVAGDTQLYHGHGQVIETWESHLVILVWVPEMENRNLTVDK